MFSGMAILDSLLPHQEAVVIKSENTTMWLKVWVLYSLFGSRIA